MYELFELLLADIMADDIEKIFGPKAGKHGEERLRKEEEKPAEDE